MQLYISRQSRAHEDTPNAPIVSVVVELGRAGGTNVFIVASCPFCGRSHTHGAGEFGEDPHRYAGSRLAHCGHHPAGTYFLEWTGEVVKKYDRK